MSRSSGVPLEEMRPHLFLLRDRDATQHLMRVSGGLDSLVMGEGQILAQVRAAAHPAAPCTATASQLVPAPACTPPVPACPRLHPCC